MWRHPITAKQIRVLAEDWGVKNPATTEGEGMTAPADANPVVDGWFHVIQVGRPSLSASAGGNRKGADGLLMIYADLACCGVAHLKVGNLVTPRRGVGTQRDVDIYL